MAEGKIQYTGKGNRATEAQLGIDEGTPVVSPMRMEAQSMGHNFYHYDVMGGGGGGGGGGG